MVLGVLTIAIYMVSQALEAYEVAPLWVFLSLCSFLNAEKFNNTRKLIVAVNFIESSKA